MGGILEAQIQARKDQTPGIVVFENIKVQTMFSSTREEKYINVL